MLRGFARLTPERRRELGKRGQEIMRKNGFAHQFSTKNAKEAGKKGGETISKNREHMKEIARKGGLASGKSKRQAKHMATENISKRNEFTARLTLLAPTHIKTCSRSHVILDVFGVEVKLNIDNTVDIKGKLFSYDEAYVEIANMI